MLRDLGIFGPLACIHPLYKEVWIIIFELTFRSAVSTDIDRLWSDVSHVRDLHLRLSPLNLIGCLNLPAKSSVSHVGWKQATVVFRTGKVAVFCQQNLHFRSISSLKKKQTSIYTSCTIIYDPTKPLNSHNLKLETLKL